jgi:hypothetical protein
LTGRVVKVSREDVRALAEFSLCHNLYNANGLTFWTSWTTRFHCTQETLRGTAHVTKGVPLANGSLRFALAAIPAALRLMPAAWSLVDQARPVDGGFLALKNAVTGIGE